MGQIISPNYGVYFGMSHSIYKGRFNTKYLLTVQRILGLAVYNKVVSILEGRDDIVNRGGWFSIEILKNPNGYGAILLW